MTNREAIENLEGCIVSEDWRDGKPTGYVTCDLTREILSMAIAALEKQEPKESPHKTLVMAKAFDGEGKALIYECVSCPGCKKWLSIFGTGKSYCPYCGQAVKSRQYNEKNRRPQNEI